MTTWAFIPCSKSKADHPCAAREMYWPSAMFRGAVRVAEARIQGPLILSAKYGLLLPSQEIEPYNETLIGKPRAERHEWMRRVRLQLLNASIVTPDDPKRFNDRYVSYLGALYVEFLVPWLRDLGYTVEEPLKGLGQGKRLQWFKQNGGAA